jgi:hypothetical protein
MLLATGIWRLASFQSLSVVLFKSGWQLATGILSKLVCCPFERRLATGSWQLAFFQSLSDILTKSVCGKVLFMQHNQSQLPEASCLHSQLPNLILEKNLTPSTVIASRQSQAVFINSA